MTAELVKRVEDWHRILALQMAALNPTLSPAEPDRIARYLVLALLCLPLYRQRNLITEAEIQALASYDQVRSRLRQINHRYGSLFPIDGLPAQVNVDDVSLTAALQELNGADFEVEFLGQAYEGCLGRWHSLTPNDSGSTKKLAETPNVKKSGGIYYTPMAIAKYIVQQTVGRLLMPCGVTDKNWQPSPQILDPSCGGGVFLLTAYRLLLHHAAQRTAQSGPSDPDCTQLPQAVRSQILLQCIYGVDIDPDAVAVTRLSLLLVWLEGYPEELSKELSTGVRQEHYEQAEAQPPPVPDLNHNMRCGNSLIGSDWNQPAAATTEETGAEKQRLLSELPPKVGGVGSRYQTSPMAAEGWGEPFDWQSAFPAIHAQGGFDAVIGNPPYLDSEWMTAHLPQHRHYCTQRYRVATGNWDLFCVFIERALNLCCPGGLTSLVVPNKLAAADYAMAARSLLTQTAHLLILRDYSRVPVFAAAVYPLVYVAQKSPSTLLRSTLLESIRYEQMRSLEQVEYGQWLNAAHHFAQPHAPWPLGTTPQTNLIVRLAQEFPSLGTLARVNGAATVAEAYALQPLIQAWQPDDVPYLKLVNSGTLDRYRICWGEKRLRYLGASYLQPVVAGQQIEQLPPIRRQQATQPKILVAGMTKRLECALDATGTVLAAKSTSIIQTDQSELDLRYLLGVLNSHLMQVYFTHYFAGNTLQGGYLRVGPPQLRQLPLPLAAPDLRDRLITLVDTMLNLCDRPPQQISTVKLEPNLEAIAQLDRQIDQLVYKIYQLSQADIASLEHQEPQHLG